ncbi:glutamine cyclotransferase [Deinococcus maricopensis DSM 21211]|uniref:Glutamine cyclotransferase n=2 Tax=Deinococcus TaxID=1298 RepID=E8UAD3_DEIML|nr:glutamine cyclotransferase [Deinococcus maricopensis DSM 21211]
MVLLSAALAVFSVSAAPSPSRAPILKPSVVRTYPHDPRAFTEGLVLDGSTLLEGTGLNGQSEVRRVALETGAVLARAAVPREVFGEGVTVLNGRVYQLSWRNGQAFVYDARTLKRMGTLPYEGEGWGLTTDGTRLIQSDGSDQLTFRDPQTFRVLGRVRVTDAGQGVVNLNELEFVNGQVYANVWMTDRIARIDAKTGRVTAWLDLSAVARQHPRVDPDDVLNGIAYDAKTGHLLVTGKRWNRLYELKLP